MLKRLMTDNAGWVVPVVGVVGVVVTFVLAGMVGGIVGLLVLLLIIIASLANSLRNALLSTPPLPELRETPELEGQKESEAQEESPYGEPSAPPEEPEAEESETPPEEDEPHEDPAESSWPGLRALFDGEVDTAKELFEIWIENADGDKRVERRSMALLWFSMQTKSSAALKDLQDLVAANPGRWAPVGALADAYRNLGEPRQGLQVLIGAAEGGLADEPQLLLKVSSLHRKLGEPDQALEATEHLLALDLDIHLRALACDERGNTLELVDRQMEALSFFEQSLSLAPNDTKLRFHVAYEYSRLGLFCAAITHYTTLLGQGEDSVARNNLGVSLNSMNVPSAAVSEYKRAAEGGDRYAPGNLASALAQAGYLDEADEWVKVGQQKENPPERVAAAAAEIAKVRERDAERRAALVTQGEEVRGLVGVLAGVDISVVPEGAWVIDGVKFEFEPTNDGTRAETGEDKTPTVIELTKQGALLRFVRREGAFLADEAEGYAVANEDTLRGITWKSNGEAVKLIKGHRQ